MVLYVVSFLVTIHLSHPSSHNLSTETKSLTYNEYSLRLVFIASLELVAPTIMYLLLQLIVFVSLLWTVQALCCTRDATLPNDATIVRAQLGYLPDNYVRVSARNRQQEPVAIQTYPLQAGAPFPTLFWLTHPAISVAIAGMERKGYIKEIQRTLDATERQRLWSAHRAYAAARWESLSETDRTFLTATPSTERMRHMLECSGIAGTLLDSQQQEVPSIKCLHTHYAHFRSSFDGSDLPEGIDLSSVNPVGQRVHQLLQLEHPELEL